MAVAFLLLAGCAGTVGQDGRVVLGIGLGQVDRDGQGVATFTPDQAVGQAAKEVAAGLGDIAVKVLGGTGAATALAMLGHALGRYRGWEENDEDRRKSDETGGGDA